MNNSQSINHNRPIKQNSLFGISALTVLAGAMLSGPVGTAMVMILKPQPAWRSADVFIDNYHWLQTIPFMLGFLLLFGSCFFIASAWGLAVEGSHRTMSVLALISTAVYAALISLNYIIQIAYVPMLVKTNQPLVGLLTMSNPSSVCWAVEMFGYLFQGIAFWLVYPVFNGGRFEKSIRRLLFINLILSIGGAVAACIDVAWAMKPFGLFMFVAWNLVLALLMGLIALDRRSAR